MQSTKETRVRGSDPIAIVINLKLGPELVRAVTAQFVEMRGGIALTVDEIRGLKKDFYLIRHHMDRESKTLAEAVRTALNESFRPCERCQKSPATYCTDCSRGRATSAPTSAPSGGSSGNSAASLGVGADGLSNAAKGP
jgi:hypothetical protein